MDGVISRYSNVWFNTFYLLYTFTLSFIYADLAGKNSFVAVFFGEIRFFYFDILTYRCFKSLTLSWSGYRSVKAGILSLSSYWKLINEFLYGVRSVMACLLFSSILIIYLLGLDFKDPNKYCYVCTSTVLFSILLEFTFYIVFVDYLKAFCIAIYRDDTMLVGDFGFYIYFCILNRYLQLGQQTLWYFLVCESCSEPINLELNGLFECDLSL